MSRLLILVAAATLVYLLYRRLSRVPPHQRRAEYFKLALAIALLIMLILTFTGRLHWVGAALTGLLVLIRQFLPTLIRLVPMLSFLKARQSPASGNAQQSTVETAILRMLLDHSDGKLSGEVLEGNYKGWFLDEMDRAQLAELLRYCSNHDADSVQLLQGYLEQRFPDGDPSQDNQQHSSSGPASSQMTRQEALSILGLAPGASDEDVIQAHRQLMQKVHPDRGGSDYLAAKINAAKDYLLAHGSQ